MDNVSKMSLLPNVSYEQAEKAAELVGSNVDELNVLGMCLAEWIYSQPHLPIAKENFYKYCGFTGRVIGRKKMSMERAKLFIDTYYTMKTLAPEFLLNRDPVDLQLRSSLDHFHFVPMPTLTDRSTRVYVGRILDKAFSPRMQTDWHKFAMMAAEVQQWEDMCLGEEIVVDVGNLSLQHVCVMTPSFVKKCVVCYLKGFLFKPRSIHFVRVPSYAEVVFNLVKTFVKPKIAQRFFIHSKEGYESLHDHFSPKHLPSDFGGEGPAIKNIQEAWLGKMSSYRDWFLEQDNYIVEENLRPGKPVTHSDIFGMEGTFRQLGVD